MKQIYLIRWDQSKSGYRNYQYTSRRSKVPRTKLRHGIRLKCKTCGLLILIGGVYTEENIIEQYLEYEDLHWKQCNGNFMVTRSYHATEINHTFVQQTTRQTTTGAPFVTISGMTVASSFFADSKKYLVTATAVHDSSTTGSSIRMHMRHGSTIFSSSVIEHENMAVTTARYCYGWFEVLTAISGEAVDMQHRHQNSTGVIGNDQCTIFVMNLSDDLTENTDWHYGNSTSTYTHTTSQVIHSGVTFTPAVNSHDWLVLAGARHFYNNVTINAQLNLVTSGTVGSNSTPLLSEEGEDSSFSDEMVWMVGRTFDNLSNAGSSTFSVAVGDISGGTQNTTEQSQVFALDLDKFQVHGSQYNDGQTSNLLDTSYGISNIATVTITPNVIGDIYALGMFNTDDVLGNTEETEARFQLDNADVPSTQTSDDYQFNKSSDNVNEMPFYMQSVDNLSVAAHTYDLDASVQNGSGFTIVAEERLVVTFTMELKSISQSVSFLYNSNEGGTSSSNIRFEEIDKNVALKLR